MADIYAEQQTDGGAASKGGERRVSRILQNVNLYEKEFEKWEKRTQEIVARYAAERKSRTAGRRRYNILWSNIQTLQPALYFSPPKPNIERRFKDKDPAGREASEVLERSTTYFVNESLFHDNAENAVLDRLLGGRGQMWVRYVPHFRDTAVTDMPGPGTEITQDAGDDADLLEENSETSSGQPPEQVLEYEEVKWDYVHWKDFGHSLARTWDEVDLLWRKVYLNKRELDKRFGREIADLIPLDHSNLDDDNSESGVKTIEHDKKATIIECWDRTAKEVVWLHKDVPAPLDVVDDPLEIKDFFPCPKPLFATLTTDSLVPTPDYDEYKDQAAELDELTARISSITKSLKVAGIYDSTAEGVERLLSEGLENKLIAVKSWAVFSEKGGLSKAVEFLPIEMIANVLKGLYEIRDKVKADLDEITGIADIIRGQSDPRETAAAQDQKGKFATMRLSKAQVKVSEFMKELVQIGAEVIAKHFSIDTLKMISGAQLMTNQEKLVFQQQQQMAMQHFAEAQQFAQLHQQAQGAPGHPANGAPAPTPTQKPPEPPPQILEQFNAPSWEDVLAVLRNNAALCFKIDIETDSTIKQDQDTDRQARLDFLETSGALIEKMAAAQEPALAPLLGEMLMFGVRGFKNARSLEQAFEETIEKIQKMPPKPAKPDPAEIKARSDLQIAQLHVKSESDISAAKLQSDAMWAAKDQASDQRSAIAEQQLQQQKFQADMALEMQKHRDQMAIEMLKMQQASTDDTKTQQTAPAGNMVNLDDMTEEDLTGHIEKRRQEKQKQIDDDAQRQLQAQQSQQIMAQNMEQNKMLASAIIQAVNSLTDAVMTPHVLQKDADGNTIGSIKVKASQ